MPTFDYITALRDRLLLLLERHAPLNAELGEGGKLRVRNRDRRGDTSPRGLGHKPTARQFADFPQLAVKADDTTDATFSEPQTFGDEEDDTDSDWPADITQAFLIEIVHEALNQDANNAFDLEVIRALRRGRAKLKDPDTPGSSLPYVLSWGPATARRSEEDVNGAVRAVTRVTVPVRIQIAESELDA